MAWDHRSWLYDDRPVRPARSAAQDCAGCAADNCADRTANDRSSDGSAGAARDRAGVVRERQRRQSERAERCNCSKS